MKKINYYEFVNLDLKKVGRAGKGKPSSPYTEMIQSLGLGEGLLIEKSEWKFKTNPPNYFPYLSQKLGIKMKIRTLADDSGWALIRKK